MSTPDVTTLPPELAPEPPPKRVWVWAKENLFSTPLNSVLTVLSVVLIALFVRGMLGFIFDAGRNWAAVGTNLRLFMTQAYPESQYVRVWVALGVVIALSALSLAVWRVGGQVAVDRLTRGIQAGSALVGLFALLGPPNVDVSLDFPVLGPFVEFLVEMVAMTGGRLVVFVIAAALFGVAHVVRRTLGERAKELSVHVMAILAAVGLAIVAVVWAVPFGQYTFVGGEALYESGTVALSTKLPITVMVVLFFAAYFAGQALSRTLPNRLLRGVLLTGWLLSLPTIVLIILRDPEWEYGRLIKVHVPLAIAFVIGGGIVLAILSNPKLGEPGRVAAGLLVLVALGSWAIPMLILIRILLLLLALFAVGAPNFAGGDRRSLLRYLALWSAVVVAVIYFLAALDTSSTLVIQAKSFLGGLALTFVLALTSIFLSFPIGVLMALGRTSSMPIFRVVSTIYIELVRGIPFITVLIFFDLILVLFLPEGLEFDSVTLAILAGTLFSGAYLAENVRGGLQAIPSGQYEAARAMGLSTLQLTVFIVLPQALRAVIPALVGQTIAIFKDTSLVAIIGLFDFLFIADKVIPAQTAFLGVRFENLLFIAAVYWLFTFSFSRASLRIEKKVGLGER